MKTKREKSYIKSCIENGNLKGRKRLFVKSFSLETAINSWTWDIYERKVFVSDELIREKAKRIQILYNQQNPEDFRVHLKFTNGWLQKLKARNRIKSYKSHCESGNVDLNVINSELPKLQEKLQIIL